MWHVISPDVLAEAKGLSYGATGFCLLVGGLLWAFGWRWHKFWIAFSITLIAGLLALSFGRAAGTQALVVAVLVALVGGVLSMELAKITAFITGGVASWLGAQAVVPQAQELWAVFLCGGLVGVLLHRFWTMLATSLIGTLLVGHSVVLLLDAFNILKMGEFTTKNPAALNGWAVASTLLGVAVQAKTGKLQDKTTEEATPAAPPTQAPIHPKVA